MKIKLKDLRLAELKDLEIGVECSICLNVEPEKHIIREQLTESILRNDHKITRYLREETKSEYEDYKNYIKNFAKQGFIYLRKS